MRLSRQQVFLPLLVSALQLLLLCCFLQRHWTRRYQSGLSATQANPAMLASGAALDPVCRNKTHLASRRSVADVQPPVYQKNLQPAVIHYIIAQQNAWKKKKKRLG